MCRPIRRRGLYLKPWPSEKPTGDPSGLRASSWSGKINLRGSREYVLHSIGYGPDILVFLRISQCHRRTGTMDDLYLICAENSLSLNVGSVPRAVFRFESSVVLSDQLSTHDECAVMQSSSFQQSERSLGSTVVGVVVSVFPVHCRHEPEGTTDFEATHLSDDKGRINEHSTGIGGQCLVLEAA